MTVQPADTVTGRFLVSIHHPAQVHFFRHIVDELHERGHAVRVCARDKDCTGELLEAFDIDHRLLTRNRPGLSGMAMTQALYEIQLLREAWRFRPDVLTAIGGLEIAHVAPFVDAATLAFDDTGARMARLLTVPSLDVVCTPRGFSGPVSGTKREYDGFHELAYLHPDRFTPQANRLIDHGVDPNAPYFLLRSCAWQATHDVGTTGLSSAGVQRLGEMLGEYGSVYVSNEQSGSNGHGQRDGPGDRVRLGDSDGNEDGNGNADGDRNDTMEVPVPSHQIHHLLAFANLYVGDSGTMATEAAVLGTPAVRINSTAADEDLPNFVELEERYGLLRSVADEATAVDVARELVTDPETPRHWSRRRKRLLADKIEVTAYAVDQLESLANQINPPHHTAVQTVDTQST